MIHTVSIFFSLFLLMTTNRNIYFIFLDPPIWDGTDDAPVQGVLYEDVTLSCDFCSNPTGNVFVVL